MNYISNWAPVDAVCTVDSTSLSSIKVSSHITTDEKFYLQTPNRKIYVDDILTKEDFVNNKQLAYKAIYEALISEIPEKADEYKTICKLYNYNYRIVVLLIETENLKNEHKQLQGALKDDF